MEDFDEAVREIAAAVSPEALEAIRIKVLGRRGSLTLAMRELGGLQPEQRREVGATLNIARDRINDALAEATARLSRGARQTRGHNSRSPQKDPRSCQGIPRTQQHSLSHRD